MEREWFVAVTDVDWREFFVVCSISTWKIAPGAASQH
jgi:hypothetical protein